MSIPSNRHELPLVNAHKQDASEVDSGNPSFHQRPQSDAVQSASDNNMKHVQDRIRLANSQQAEVANDMKVPRPEVVQGSTESSKSLGQLSEVASKCLEVKKESESLDDHHKVFTYDPDVIAPRQTQQKRRDLAGDMFGSCLHSSTTGLSSTQSSPTNPTVSKKQMKKRDRSYLRKGKWTVSKMFFVFALALYGTKTFAKTHNILCVA